MKSTPFSTLAAAIAAAIGTLAFSSGAQASGFSIPEVSTAGIGTANALVANPKETGAFAYNPSAMGFHDASSVSLGMILIGPSFEVDTANGNHDSQGADWLNGPMINAAIKINDQWRAGLSVSAPFGLETRWSYGTFPALSQTLTIPTPMGAATIPTGNHPTASKLEIVDVAPTAAFRVNENLSLGAGLDVYWIKTAQLDSNLATLRGDGTGLGFNLSALYQHDAWSVGIAYRSAATVGVGGSYTPQNQTLVAAGALQQGQPASVDVNLPWRLQLGFRYEINAQLAVELDWTRNGWSEFDKLTIKGNNSGGIITEDVNDWKDANAYRIGATYQIRPQTQLRLGYAYDERAQPDDHFSARVPDTDRSLFGIGLAQDLADGYRVEIGYMYVLGEDREYRSSTPWTGGAVNGTDALDGNYKTTAHLIGLELTKTF